MTLNTASAEDDALWEVLAATHSLSTHTHRWTCMPPPLYASGIWTLFPFFSQFYCGTSSIAELLKLPQSIKECAAVLCFRKLEIVGTLKWSYWGKKKNPNKTFWWFCLPRNMPVGAFRIAVAVHHHTVTFTNHSTVKELSFTFVESRSWHTCYTWQASQAKSNSLLRCPCVSSAT